MIFPTSVRRLAAPVVAPCRNAVQNAVQNTEAFAITVGETAQRNEMCMAIGYYFPAGNASCR